MSRCIICNYSDFGLSDIPFDGRKIENDVCSKCQEEVSASSKANKTDSFNGTIGGLISDDLSLIEDDLDFVDGIDGLPESNEFHHVHS